MNQKTKNVLATFQKMNILLRKIILVSQLMKMVLNGMKLMLASGGSAIREWMMHSQSSSWRSPRALPTPATPAAVH